MTSSSMPPPHSITLTEYAFFFDFDGTLVDIAETPESIVVPSSLIEILAKLQTLTSGALALVSGRQVEDLLHYISVPKLSLAGCHGAQWTLQGDKQDDFATDISLTYPHLFQALQRIAQQLDLLLENKGLSIALHFRNHPELEEIVDEKITPIVKNHSDLTVMRGKCIREIKAKSCHKGRAIERFMQLPPFSGRIPLFIGDDVTDEDAFVCVNQKQGVSIKVGNESTHAQFRLSNPDEVHRYLTTLIEENTQR